MKNIFCSYAIYRDLIGIYRDASGEIYKDLIGSPIGKVSDPPRALPYKIIYPGRVGDPPVKPSLGNFTSSENHMNS